MFIKSTITIDHPPKLAAPGAGVPFTQKLMMRYFIRPFVAAKTPWEISEKKFNRINEKILTEINGLTEEQLQKPILIPPQTGLEDSSRFWSMTMTLEHLIIVTSQMFDIIFHLAKGEVPNGKADTAAVKPHGQLSSTETLATYKKIITTDFQTLNTQLAQIKQKNTSARFLHPWFGPMNAQSWYWLLATHHGLHLQQIREIKKGLRIIRPKTKMLSCSKSQRLKCLNSK